MSLPLLLTDGHGNLRMEVSQTPVRGANYHSFLISSSTTYDCVRADQLLRHSTVGPPFIVKKYITNDYMAVLTAEFYSNPEPTCVQWYLSAKLIVNCTMAGYNIMQTNVNILMYQKNVHVEGYVTNITLENLTNGKYTVVIANAFGKTKEEFEVNTTGKCFK
ncbi:unnamed protein product [Mytilus coruscus]|uniref:Uncharacterized protein n=1 Tax=Mytilus coruscus TaxID=42192 RepID=A0A6J8AAI5_MYTCO|nr:unnamed protein product [Mytilus coruscus]